MSICVDAALIEEDKYDYTNVLDAKITKTIIKWLGSHIEFLSAATKMFEEDEAKCVHLNL